MTSTELLREQWTALRAWIEDSVLLDHVNEPSALEGWTVRDLVTHIGQSFLALTLLGPAPGDAPQSFHGYVSHYRSVAQQTADGTRELSRSFANDLLGGIDRCAMLGFRALDRLKADVVRGSRGAITLDDFVMTRLVEVVVHGDDLERSVLEVSAAPLLDAAVAQVSHVLVEAYIEVTGVPPDVEDELEWIRTATGRLPSDDEALPIL